MKNLTAFHIVLPHTIWTSGSSSADDFKRRSRFPIREIPASIQVSLEIEQVLVSACRYYP
ncbi:hypothetical protein ACUXCC_000742 [Cytobacillus horneckiae]|uniref:hypothetical protein n=1 Tax=Cytobacillus horneckiae TaxID=549687 RepID=UPI000A808C31|nr:hypothetical protein [Cytobacillus horneckiae]MBN6886086.1 hypothetical protein [Cytobacillus horneckiae]